MESVLGRIEKRENARKDHVQHGVHGVTGQAVLLHVGRESGTESGNVDPQQGEIINTNNRDKKCFTTPISATPRGVPVPHRRRRAVTLVPAEDGVIGRHGVSVPCLVGEE